MELVFAQTPDQKQTLSHQQIMNQKLLQIPLLDIRHDMLQTLGQNIFFTGIVDREETSLDALKEKGLGEAREDYDPDDLDQWTDRDADRVEKMQEAHERRIVNQKAHENLQDHLLAQVGVAGFTREEEEFARKLIGQIDNDGYFKGTFADVQMTTGHGEAVQRAMLKRIQTFDPEGCGSLGQKEFWLSRIGDIGSTRLRGLARKVVEAIPDNMGADSIPDVTGLSRACGLFGDELKDVVEAILLLGSGPATGFSAPDPEYVNPECHLFQRKDGTLVVVVDEWKVPEPVCDKNYLAMLESDETPAEAKVYLREHLQKFNEYRDALANRGETLRQIAQAIVDVQGDYLLKRTNVRNRITERAIAEKLEGISESAVSRAVCGKWMTTPRGFVELRQLFTQGDDALAETIKELISAEDKAHPLSDDALVPLLEARGIKAARRTVMKYREKLGIPNSSKRKIR